MDGIDELRNNLKNEATQLIEQHGKVKFENAITNSGVQGVILEDSTFVEDAVVDRRGLRLNVVLGRDRIIKPVKSSKILSGDFGFSTYLVEL